MTALCVNLSFIATPEHAFCALVPAHWYVRLDSESRKLAEKRGKTKNMRSPTSPFEPLTHGKPTTHAFGSFRLDVGARKLWRGHEPVTLPSRAFDLLVYLIEHHPRLIDKEELLRSVWNDVIVTDDSLIHAVSVLRRALADAPGQAQYIETIPRRGYRFVGHLVDPTPSEQPPLTRPAPDAPPPLPTAATRLPRSYRRLSAYAAALAVFAVALAGGAWLLRAQPSQLDASSALRLFQPPPPGTRIVSGGVLSPDAEQVVFVARDHATGKSALWLRPLHAPEAHRLVDTDGATKPFWSPDGRRVAFFANGGLAAVDLVGERAREIVRTVDSPAGGTWGADDTIVYADWARGLFTVNAAGGPPRPLRSLDRSARHIAHAWPQFLPDGRRFLYQVVSLDSTHTGAYIGSVDASRDTRVLATESPAVFAPPRHLVHVQNGMLLAEELDTSLRTTTGRSILLARDVAPPSLGDGDVVSAARNLIAFRAGEKRQNLVWLDRAGRDLGALPVPKVLFNPRLSPDESFVLASSSVTNDPGLWRAGLKTAEYARLATDAVGPLWAPDGQRVAFTADGSTDVLIRTAGTDGTADPLLEGGTVKVLNDWAPNGDSIVYTQLGDTTRLDLWTVDTTTGRAAPLLATEFNEMQARISPDGRWIAYVSDASGALEVYVRRYPNLDAPRRVSQSGGGQPQWRRDQGELFFISPDRTLISVGLEEHGELSFRKPTTLFSLPIGGGPMDARDHYSASADGQRFLVDSAAESEHRAPITVIVNWTALARETAPEPTVAFSGALH